MIIYYLDSSGWVKRYFKETGTDWILSLFAQKPKIACASFGLVEILATLARRTKSVNLPNHEIAQIKENIKEDWRRFIHIHLTPEVLNIAIDVAYNQAIRGADAIHLASALVLQKRLDYNHSLTSITADTELRTACNIFNIPVIDPNDK